MPETEKCSYSGRGGYTLVPIILLAEGQMRAAGATEM